MHVSKPIECTKQNVNLDVNYGLELLEVSLPRCKKCTTLIQVVPKGRTLGVG